jgi:hydrogenase maturation protease
VVGLGSRMGRDDGIGLSLVSDLAADDEALGERCVLLEGADMATLALFLMEQASPVILVDAADMGMAPGAYRLFDEQEARLILRSDSVSTHGFGLAEGLGIARALGFEAPVRIFGAQPFDLSFEPGLTDEMAAQYPELLSALRRAVADATLDR